MRGRAAFGAAAVLLGGGLAQAITPPSAPEPPASIADLAPGSTAAQCAACHTGDDGRLELVGLDALRSLPPEWSLLHEDGFDLDGDGIAGRLRYVSGPSGPLIGIYGRNLAAARLQDFARIAGAAHDIDLSDDAVMDDLLHTLRSLSPEPAPLPAEAIARFEARGCGRCHVTDSFSHEGQSYRPLSDFLLHDLGDGLVRTEPLWGCEDCLAAPGHAATTPADRSPR